jgi:cytoskeletal protein CcmA (bactofilin family)
MFNKREESPSRPPLTPSSAGQAFASGAETRSDRASIGPSVSIVGNVSGAEDLTIFGKLEGKVDVPHHSVTVGRSARVEADIHAKFVSVEGEVRGNLVAGEQILIRKTATMLGNLTAPRVGLEDGCCFKGSVDMEMRPVEAGRGHGLPAPRHAPAPEGRSNESAPKPQGERVAAAADAAVAPARL